MVKNLLSIDLDWVGSPRDAKDLLENLVPIIKKNKFKFVQLTNGDRIFAEIDMKESENGFLKLKKPLKLFSAENDVSIHYSFTPWIPFTDDEKVPLAAKSIVTIATLNDEFITMYNRALENTENPEETTSNLEQEIGYLN